jgi:ribonuclease HI
LKDREGATLFEGWGVVAGTDPRTNNTAEWNALLEGIRFARQFPLERLSIQGDSQLVIHQLNRRWGAKKPHLARLRDECLSLLLGIDWDASWVPREQNDGADGLSRRAYESRRNEVRKVEDLDASLTRRLAREE